MDCCDTRSASNSSMASLMISFLTIVTDGMRRQGRMIWKSLVSDGKTPTNELRHFESRVFPKINTPRCNFIAYVYLVGVVILALLIKGGARINRSPGYSALDGSLSEVPGRDSVHPHVKETFMPKVLLRLSS